MFPSEFDVSITEELKYRKVRHEIARMCNPRTGIKGDFLDKLDRSPSIFQKMSKPETVCGDLKKV